MPFFQVLPQEKYRRAAWKNGLGYTDEIAIHPPGGDLRKGDFLWRLSSARIEQASAFSVFPEHDRVLVILEGKGLRLFHRFEEGDSEDEVMLPLFEPYEFPGDIQSRCELVSGAIRDLSVFVRKGEAEAQARTIALENGGALDWEPQGRWNFLFSAQGIFELHDGSEAFRAEAGTTLSVELAQPIEHPLSLRAPEGPARLVAVEIR